VKKHHPNPLDPLQHHSDKYTPLRHQVASLCQHCSACVVPTKLVWKIVPPNPFQEDPELKRIFDGIGDRLNQFCEACHEAQKAHDDNDKTCGNGTIIDAF